MTVVGPHLGARSPKAPSAAYGQLGPGGAGRGREGRGGLSKGPKEEKERAAGAVALKELHWRGERKKKIGLGWNQGRFHLMKRRGPLVALEKFVPARKFKFRQLIPSFLPS